MRDQEIPDNAGAGSFTPSVKVNLTEKAVPDAGAEHPRILHSRHNFCAAEDVDLTTVAGMAVEEYAGVGSGAHCACALKRHDLNQHPCWDRALLCPFQQRDILLKRG